MSTNLITELDDEKAVRVLDTFAKAQVRRGGLETALTPAVREALATEFHVAPSEIPINRGDLARQALLILSDDPNQRAMIETLIRGASPQVFLGPVEAAAVVSAVLVTLQTHVRFERDKEGRVTIMIEKRPTKDSLLKPLVQKLLSFAKM
jgi:hypothetical protein